MSIKKILLGLVVIGIVGLIAFNLYQRQKDLQKTRIHPIMSYPVTVVRASEKKMDESLTLIGLILANNDVPIVSQIQGNVTHMYVQLGRRVAAGQPIAKVDDVTQKAKYLATRTSYEKAQKDWERYQKLHQQGLVSDSDLEATRQIYSSAESDYVNAQHDYENSLITSPISGVVTTLPVDLGTMVTSGMTIADVVDDSWFKTDLNVDEADAFRLKVGDAVDVETDVYPNVKLKGRIDSISAKGDEVHTYPVEVILRNDPQHPLKSGMYGRITFHFQNSEAIVLPRTAIWLSMQRPQVFVVQKQGKRFIAKVRDVATGHSSGTEVIVTDGLKAGEVVVANGQYNLSDNIAVNIVNGKFDDIETGAENLGKTGGNK